MPDARLDEVRLTEGEVEVVVLPGLGARLHRMRVFGHELLRTPDDPTVHAGDPFFWGAYVMAPWCNRVDARATRVGRRTVDLAPNFPDGSAIHGQVCARPWATVGDGVFRAIGGGDGWPWEYEVTLGITVAARSIRVELRLANRSTDPMPAGIGIHPWWRRPVQIAIHGDAVHATNLATGGAPERVHGPFDLRQLRDMPADLDATWTDLGRPPVELGWPAFGLQATMDASATVSHIVAASPSGLDAIAVEPQTHAPYGLRRLLTGEPGALAMLDPGGALELGVELSFELPAGDDA
jgi:aldose 1-epimerase